MALETPGEAGAHLLGPLASHYLDVEALPWKPTQVPGIDIKVLVQDKETGLLTALFRWQPGTELPMHEHVEIEQSYILEGSIVDAEGEARAGGYVWRPRGNRHVARSPHGALVLSFFLKPNVFIDQFAGQKLE
ncbi:MULTISPECIES: cupin domain-containing protein [Pseudacidovorax]|jgi:anti-sigma factor ChrR (cupin superfamily)|uniref:ChrR-like protein with cupin domain n=1 Tax=Pseudacidovorax intermedius TaxID=433924 RepID=A0A370FDS7_9BURK|nr:MULTISPECIES: cupin domain-containing protein [Pseudacidovorax]MBP6895989.1 cupin domain-containing protein [Pseudacidovorax sp.]RDI24195.1 ChrR-like protein with cupin domain [Pseudacidovorax intermedius]